MIVKQVKRIKRQKIVGGSLPDIDIDIPSNKRERVKEYLENRYSRSQVCIVGTYGTLGVKGALKDLAKQKGIDFKEVNIVSKLIRPDVNAEWEDIFTWGLCAFVNG